jgi:hypothetical protein
MHRDRTNERSLGAPYEGVFMCASLRAARRRIVIGAMIFLISLSTCSVRAQEPAPPAAPPPPANQQTPPAENPSAPASSSSKHSRSSHANDFLIIGTVFTDKAYAFPGVHLRVRRSTEKKFRWETYTNSRGEFAIRVPQGAEYEIVVVTKGFTDQSKTISAKSGISEDSVVFEMQPAAGGKK